MIDPHFYARFLVREGTPGAIQTTTEIAGGTRTAGDVVSVSLSRISQTEAGVHALLSVDERGALEAASRIDDARRLGRSIGPAGGVPIVVKDNIDVAGHATTAGSRALPGGRSPGDAEIIRRLREAGAVLVGKANLDEFAMGATTESSVFGPTRNPHDLSRTPGGSSGGSAASVAAGQVPWAVGTDTGGSIREPAAQCGLVGVKPSSGQMPGHGIVPFAPSLDQAGPLARNVADAALLQRVMAGAGRYEAAAHRGAQDPSLCGFRIGVIVEMSGRENSATVLHSFERSLEDLSGLGADLIEVSIPRARDALSLYYVISSAESVDVLGPYARAGILGAQAMGEGRPGTRYQRSGPGRLVVGASDERRGRRGIRVLLGDRIADDAGDRAKARPRIRWPLRRPTGGQCWRISPGFRRCHCRTGNVYRRECQSACN